MKRALFSLYSLEKADEFAAILSRLGWKIIASRETCQLLSKKGIPVIDVADFTGVHEDYGFPPTLHPKIEKYLTSSKGPRIDLVYVLPYPLSVGNDIGGRTLLALAAKGKRIPVMSVSDMENVTEHLKNKKMLPQALRESLISKANALIASHYDDLVSDRESYDFLTGCFQYPLLNGENPYQIPAHLFSIKRKDALSLPDFKQVSGERPCFTNLADADSILQTISLAAEAFKIRYRKVPYICIAAKHGNPCGMGVSWNDASQAVNKALFGNPKSIWGGEVIVDFAIDDRLARLLFKSKKRKEMFNVSAWMLDLILASHFSPGAQRILGKRSSRKLFENRALALPFLPQTKFAYRFVRGGFLRQPPHHYVLDFKKARTRGECLDKQHLDSLIIAWSVAWSSNHGGNEVALAKDRQLIGAGGGPSTIEAAQIALHRAESYGHDTKGAVFAANAFFPFTDAPSLLAEAGLVAGLVPSGGKRETLVKDYFQKKKLSMVYLNEPYRGFSRH
jgi:phosphoribosylaminoimidazolecarboxamide formyltransferase/IMP cyclohydrolase